MSLRLQGAGMARCRVDPSDGSTHHFQLKVIENHLHEHERFAWTAAAAAAAAAALSPGCAGAGSTRPEGRRHDAHTWGHHDKTPLIRLLTMLPIGALTRLGGHDAAEHGARHLPTAVCRHARVGRLAQWHDARAQQRSVGGAAAPQQDSSRTAAAAATALQDSSGSSNGTAGHGSAGSTGRGCAGSKQEFVWGCAPARAVRTASGRSGPTARRTMG